MNFPPGTWLQLGRHSFHKGSNFERGLPDSNINATSWQQLIWDFAIGRDMSCLQFVAQSALAGFPAELSLKMVQARSGYQIIFTDCQGKPMPA